MKLPVQFGDVLGAYERIKDRIRKTPVLTSRSLNELTGSQLFFKCENFQRAGAFKYRGANNALLLLTREEMQRGVLTHSSGNHAAALALASRRLGIRAFIVMPRNAPAIKKQAVLDFGAEVVECEPTLEAREKTAAAVQEKTGAVFIHPYNNRQVIAGQGTAALELLREVGELDAVFAPVGGGGLLSGTAVVTRYLNPGAEVFGCEPANADDAYRSFHAGKLIPVRNPDTIADGLRTSLAPITFEMIRKLVSDILLVSEEDIVIAMRLLWERLKIVVEPSGAVPFAAALRHKEKFRKKRVGIILSGGNVDLEKMPFGREGSG